MKNNNNTPLAVAAGNGVTSSEKSASPRSGKTSAQKHRREIEKIRKQKEKNKIKSVHEIHSAYLKSFIKLKKLILDCTLVEYEILRNVSKLKTEGFRAKEPRVATEMPADLWDDFERDFPISARIVKHNTHHPTQGEKEEIEDEMTRKKIYALFIEAKGMQRSYIPLCNKILSLICSLLERKNEDVDNTYKHKFSEFEKDIPFLEDIKRRRFPWCWNRFVFFRKEKFRLVKLPPRQRQSPPNLQKAA